MKMGNKKLEKIIKDMDPEVQLRYYRKIKNKRQISKLAIKLFEKYLDNNRFKSAAEFGKEYGLPKNQILDASIKALQLLNDITERDAEDLIKEYNIPKEKILEVATEQFEKALGINDYFDALKIGETYNFSEEQLLEVAPKALKQEKENGNYHLALDIGKKYNLPKNQLLNIAIEELKKVLNEKWDLDSANKLIEEYDIPKDAIRDIAIKAVKTHLTKYIWSPNLLENFEKKLNLPEEVCLDGITEAIRWEILDFKKVEAIKEKYNLPDNIILDAALEGFKENIISEHNNEYAEKIKQLYFLDKYESTKPYSELFDFLKK